MKQTAVEWLMDKYRTQNGVITAADYHKAKEMEKGFRKYLTIWTNVRKYIEQHEKHN